MTAVVNYDLTGVKRVPCYKSECLVVKHARGSHRYLKKSRVAAELCSFTKLDNLDKTNIVNPKVILRNPDIGTYKFDLVWVR